MTAAFSGIEAESMCAYAAHGGGNDWGSPLHEMLTPLQKARRFARYNYVAEPQWAVLDLFQGSEFKQRQRELAGLSRPDLISQMDQCARRVFEETFDGAPCDIVIPLSGGRDSRLILCMAREFGALDRITTLTWSTPDGLDWRIASAVAKHFGVAHAQIDTRRERISLAHLRAAFMSGAHWTDLMLAHFNRVWRTQATNGAVAIIGYLGGPPVGAHYELGDERMDLPSAVVAFERLNARWNRGASMIGGVQDHLIDPQRLGYAEQLDLVFRQEGYLRRIVAGPPGAALTPYAHPDWLRFTYALPGAARADTNLYSAYLLQTFPDAFVTGVSGAYGLNAGAPPWRRRLQRRMLTAAHAAKNAVRARGFATLDKYGDERDLLAALDLAPAQFNRLAHHKEPHSVAEAARLRARIMLACNLMLDSEQQCTGAYDESASRAVAS